MAVYKKTYRPYEGALTAPATRLFVITRYAMEDLRRSKFLNTFYALSFAYPLIAALLIYLAHNTSALQLINFGGGPGGGGGRTPGAGLISVNLVFFYSLLGWQSMLGLFLAAFIGPGLVSPDLANNALGLYLARPFSRVEYVLGKMSVLMILMSLMTWIPGLLLLGAGLSRRQRMGRRKFTHRVGHVLRRVGVDYCCFHYGAGALRVGEVEAGGGRVDVRRLLRGRGVRGRD